MNHTDQTNIRLVVEDEQTLYTSFSPEDEFDESVKTYIKAKIVGREDKKNIRLTVVSQKPINEEKFRFAVYNWTKEEAKKLRRDEKYTIFLMMGLLLFGSISLMVSIALENYYAVVKYSLLPIMGSLALTEAVRVLIINLPTISIERRMIKEIERHNVIKFEYASDKKAWE